MWGCHFLIFSSNALWRKFVKLDQGCLKLVYKGVSEGRRRRNVVHLRRLRCLQSARLGGTASPPPFSPLHSCSECRKMPCFFDTSLLKGCGRKWCGEGGYEKGNVRKDRNICFLCSQSRRGVKAFFHRGMCSQIVC